MWMVCSSNVSKWNIEILQLCHIVVCATIKKPDMLILNMLYVCLSLAEIKASNTWTVVCMWRKIVTWVSIELKQLLRANSRSVPFQRFFWLIWMRHLTQASTYEWNNEKFYDKHMLHLVVCIQIGSVFQWFAVQIQSACIHLTLRKTEIKTGRENAMNIYSKLVLLFVRRKGTNEKKKSINEKENDSTIYIEQQTCTHTHTAQERESLLFSVWSNRTQCSERRKA